jgi:N6-adenosine-specific RNA methylase IME4
MAVSSGHNLSRAQWAERINEVWDHIQEKAVTGFFDLGNVLVEAKEALVEQHGHGLWIEMCESDLKFDRRVAYKFMKLATWKTQMTLNESHLRQMPPDYNTMYGISCLDRETFDRLYDEGIICPKLQRNEISRILRRERVEEDEERVLNIEPIVGKFRTLVLDPAWEYVWLSLAGRARPGYAMQTIEQLRDLDVAAWADEEVGCHLYCWTTNNFMAEACKLVAHWGFQHRVVLTWIKPPPFGLGSYFRNSTEHCIFATRGDTTTRPAAASISTHFEAPRGEHSEKPECFYDMVRAASYPPFGEGNQREPREDFTNLFCPVTVQDEAAE